MIPYVVAFSDYDRDSYKPGVHHPTGPYGFQVDCETGIFDAGTAAATKEQRYSGAEIPVIRSFRPARSCTLDDDVAMTVAELDLADVAAGTVDNRQADAGSGAD